MTSEFAALAESQKNEDPAESQKNEDLAESQKNKSQKNENLTEEQKPVAEQHKKNWIVPAVCTLLIWGFWAFLPKLALQSMEPHSVIFYEAFGNLFVAIPVLFSLKFKMQRNRNAVLVTFASSVLTVLAVLFYFFALQRGPVAVIVTMTAMYPIIALVLAATVLKERLNRIQIVAVFMALASILLLAMP